MNDSTSESNSGEMPDDLSELEQSITAVQTDLTAREKIMCSALFATALDFIWLLSFDVNTNQQIVDDYLTINDSHPKDFLFAAAIAGVMASMISTVLAIRRYQRLCELDENKLNEYEKAQKDSLLPEIFATGALNSFIFLDAFRQSGLHGALKGASNLLLNNMGVDLISSAFIVLCLVRMSLALYRLQKVDMALVDKKAELANKVMPLLGEESDEWSTYNGLKLDKQLQVLELAFKLLLERLDEDNSEKSKLLQGESSEVKALISALANNLKENKSKRADLMKVYLSTRDLTRSRDQESLNLAQSCITLGLLITISVFPQLLTVAVLTLFLIGTIRFCYDGYQHYLDESRHLQNELIEVEIAADEAKTKKERQQAQGVVSDLSYHTEGALDSDSSALRRQSTSSVSSISGVFASLSCLFKEVDDTEDEEDESESNKPADPGISTRGSG